MNNQFFKFFFLFILVIVLIPKNIKAFEGNNYYSYSGLSEINDSLDIDYNKSLFVSPTGDDSNDGSIDNPLKTINQAIELASDNDTIYLRDGIYNEAVNINKSNLTIRNYPNENANITGDNISNNAIILINPNLSNITIYGLTISDKNEIDIEAVYGIFVHGGVKNLIIQNNEFTNINGNANHKFDVHGYNASAVIIYGNQEEANKNILITGNKIHDMDCGKSEAIALTGYVANADIIENDIKDIGNIGIDIAGNYKVNSNPDLDYARYVYVAGNKIDNAVSLVAYNAGIYVDGASGVLVERNYITNCPYGISVGMENNVIDEIYNVKDVIVSSNLLLNNKVVGIRIGSLSSKNSSVTKTTIIYNTIIHPSNASSSALVIGKGHDNDIINNVFVDNGTWNNLVFTDDGSNSSVIYNININNNYLYSKNHAGFPNGAYFNLASQSYSETDFKNLDFVNDNIIGEYAELNDDYSTKVSSILDGIGIDNEYAYVLRDYNGYFRTDPIDIGYIANTNNNSANEIIPLKDDYALIDPVLPDDDQDNDDIINQTNNPATGDNIIYYLFLLFICFIPIICLNRKLMFKIRH